MTGRREWTPFSVFRDDRRSVSIALSAVAGRLIGQKYDALYSLRFDMLRAVWMMT